MLKRMFGCFAVVLLAVAMHQPVAAGPNANAVLSWDIDASDNKRDDGNTSGTVAGAGTDVVVEVFITGLAGPIIGGAFSIDTNRLTVKSAAATPGLSVLGTTARTVSLGGFPPGVALPNGYLGTVTLTTTSDVTGTEFTVSASINVADGTSPFATDMLTAATPLTFNASTQTPTPDFNGDGTVDFADFVVFAGQFGTRRGDSRYQAKYDLNSDGAIDFRDFLSFAGSYGQSVPPSGGGGSSGGGGGGGGGSGGSGGGSSSPDLVVESPSVSDRTLTPGQSFTLQATVRNRGTGQSASTTLTYYRSSNSTISTSDTEVGTDSVSGLSASRTGSESIRLTAPSSTGTYYYGACVASVSGESNTDNNCSEGVRVTVVTSDLIVESPSVDNTTPTPGQSITLSATVRNQGTAEVAATTLRYYQSSDATITTDDTAVGKDAVPELAASATSEQSSNVTAPSTAGTYYYGACVEAVSGESNTDNNCSTGVRVTVSSGGGSSGGGGGGGGSSSPDLIVEQPSVSESTLTSEQSFTLQATVRNRGTGQSPETTLHYYQSSDATITTDDTAVGTDLVNGLSASRTGAESISLTAPSTAGTYYYGACVASVTGESDTNNNCSEGVRVMVVVPDLIVESFSVSDSTVGVGKGITARATVRNQGMGSSESTRVVFYVDDDSYTNPPHVRGLSASETYEVSRGLRVPSRPGTYSYHACVEDVRYETNTDNNCSNAVRVTVLGPDLIVESFSVSDSTVGVGKGITARATVRNQGMGSSESTRVVFYVDDDSYTNPPHVRGLSASETYEVSRGLRVPSRAGTYSYHACVEDVRDETNTDNNCSNAVRVTVLGPDLIVESFSVSDSTVGVGDVITARATVRNQGMWPSESTRVVFYWDDNSYTNPPHVRGLSASETYEVSSRLRVPSRAGTYSYHACVEDVRDETNTDNNCSNAVRVTVLGPDLIVESVSVSDNTVNVGQEFTLYATVRNQGGRASRSTILSYFRSSNSTISTSNTKVGRDSVSGLSASGTGSESISLTAPSSAGTYYYGACVYPDRYESNTDNNCSDGVRVTVSSGGGIVVIPDAYLRNVISDSLNKARSAPITRADMATLTRINAPGSITDLTGLEFATNLTTLGLQHNQISDIAALSGLTNLTSLNLWNNQISDIAALSGLTNLTMLDLEGNPISDIAALSGLTKLEWLWLRLNQISDITALSGLTNLTTLGLQHNQISDIAALSGLTNLTTLGLSGNRISDIAALSGLTNLTTLGLSGNRISDIAALSGLTNLTWLVLYDNQISDIAALSGLTNLRTLNLEDNQISDIAALSGLTNLTALFLRDNPLSATSINTHIPALRARGVTVNTRRPQPPTPQPPTPQPPTPPGGGSGGGACSVGQVLSPGQSCNVGNNRFVVRSDGYGCFGFACAGESLTSNRFRASRIAGTSRWRIDALP